MENQTIEQAVEEIVSTVETVEFLHGVPVNLPSQYKADLRGVARKALQAQRDAGVGKGRISVLEDFDSLMQADALIGFSADEWKAVQKFFQFNDEISGWKQALTPPTK
jgi:hypothetical protein